MINSLIQDSTLIKETKQDLYIFQSKHLSFELLEDSSSLFSCTCCDGILLPNRYIEKAVLAIISFGLLEERSSLFLCSQLW